MITPLLHHAIASAISPIDSTAEPSERPALAEPAAAMAAEPAPPNATAADGSLTTMWRVEPMVGNKWLEQSGSKAGFYLCHLRDRPISCELAEGKGQDLYDNILSGKVRGRSFAFNDDGYRDMKVADKWQAFIHEFLPTASPYEDSGSDD